MNAPDATGVVRLLCLSVLVDAATAVAGQQVNREFRQGARLAVDLLNLAATTALTVALALGGFGAWSLAWGQLVGNVISAGLLFYVVRVWPRPGFDVAKARQLLAFGLPLAGASLLTFAMLNIDYVVIGWRLDATALGLYLMAFNVLSWPVSTFSMVVRRVSLAAFSRTQGKPVETETTFIRFATLLALAAVPACIMLSGLATSTVLTLYGQPWVAAAAALEYLAVLGLVRVFAELAYDLLVSRGQVSSCMVIHVVWLVALVVVLPLTASADGIRGVAVGQAAVAGLLVLPILLVAVTPAGVSLRRMGRALVRPLLGGGLLFVVLEVVELLTRPSLAQLAIGAALGAAVYLPVVWPMRRLLTTLPKEPTSVPAWDRPPEWIHDRTRRVRIGSRPSGDCQARGDSARQPADGRRRCWNSLGRYSHARAACRREARPDRAGALGRPAGLLVDAAAPSGDGSRCHTA